MRIAITGATGMIGSALSARLRDAGHSIVPISRQPLPDGIRWDPNSGVLPTTRLEGVDAVVHLAGENIAGGRWSEARKALLRSSRVPATSLLAKTLATMPNAPTVLVSMSAVGIYGDRGDELLDERSALGDDFLAELGREWEAAAEPARQAGIRVVHPRCGVVLSTAGGMLDRLLLPFRLGLGGPVGSGEQWLSWIAIDDLTGVFVHLLESDSLAGPVNVATPQPVRNREFASALGIALHRPTVIPLPAFALRMAFGEMADATLLASQRVVPAELEKSGYQWQYPAVGAALQHLVGDGTS